MCASLQLPNVLKDGQITFIIFFMSYGYVVNSPTSLEPKSGHITGYYALY